MNVDLQKSAPIQDSKCADSYILSPPPGQKLRSACIENRLQREELVFLARAVRREDLVGGAIRGGAVEVLLRCLNGLRDLIGLAL